MRCTACPVPNDFPCLGQTQTFLCGRAAQGEPGFRSALYRTAVAASQGAGFTADAGRMKVGIVTPGCFVGGAEMWMLALLRGCDHRQLTWHGVAVVYPQHVYPPMADEMARYCPVARGPAALDQLYAECDVVILWGVAAYDQRIPPRPRRSRIVMVSHGIGPWTARVFDGAANADAWVAVSSAALGPIPEPYRSRAVVIHNGVERGRLVPRIGRNEQRERWGVARDRKVLGYLGRLSDEKNPKALAEAVAALPGKWVGVQVGDGLGVEGVTAHARATAPGRVYHPGATNDIGSALAAFDEMLLPSHEEACSLTCLEAWTAGVPLIATPVGLVPEYPDLVRIIPCGATGKQIAAAVLADANDPNGTRERTRSARAIAREQFSAPVFAANWTRYLVALAPQNSLVGSAHG